jgi:hypothetical protein
MKILQFIIAALFYTSSFGQTNLIPISKLKSYSVAPNVDTLYKYRDIYPDNIRVVKKNKDLYFTDEPVVKDTFPSFIKLPKKDSLMVKGSLSSILRGKVSVLEVSDGYLVAGEQGEFGGILYWFSKTDTGKYLIEWGNFHSFLKRDNKIYTIEGSAHGSACKGSILEMKQDSGKWHTETFLNLNSAPFIIKSYKRNSFIVLSSSGMYLIDKKKRIQTLMDGYLWEYSLYPNSIVIKNKIIYAGVGIGIIKYNLAAKKEEWLMSNPVLMHPKAQ